MQKKREAKKSRRETRKDRLAEVAEKRLETNPGPDHGVSEADIMQMRMQVVALTTQGNESFKRLQQFERVNLEERALEAFYLSRTMARSLIESGLLDAVKVSRDSLKLQEDDLDITDKAQGSLDTGDMAVIRFSLWHEGQKIDDQTGNTLAYEMGSRMLPCEDGMLGMRIGEERTLDVVFGESFILADFIGKILQIKVELTGIKIKKIDGIPAASPEPEPAFDFKKELKESKERIHHLEAILMEEQEESARRHVAMQAQIADLLMLCKELQAKEQPA